MSRAWIFKRIVPVPDRSLRFIHNTERVLCNETRIRTTQLVYSEPYRVRAYLLDRHVGCLGLVRGQERG